MRVLIAGAGIDGLTTALALQPRGPECVLDMAEERAPGGFAHVEDVFAPGELAEIAARYKRVAGFAPIALR